MYQKVEPVSESIMLNKRYHGHFTICEKLREIYVSTEDEDIKLKCRVAMAMAKKMHKKLKFYKAQQNLAQGEKENEKESIL